MNAATCKKIYTCTPVAFHADDWFFIRDTGLISSTLRSLGVESKTIMPLPWYDGDKQEHIVRTAPTNLRSTRWWKAQELDAVVLYSWGDPRYTLVARAIRKAGIRLIIHLDYAHTITTTPTADNFLRNNSYYGPAIADKLHPFVTPVAPHFRYNGEKKEPTVLCIGNWTLPVKRPDFMRSTISQLLEQHPTVQVEIYGKTDEHSHAWHTALPLEHRQRVRLAGFADNATLPEIYNRAQICLCTSESEGTHISSAEALCCGCSIVTTNRPERLPMVHWYTSKDSGCISEHDTPSSLASAITQELNAWQHGQRNPQHISATWQPLFLSDIALSNLFHLRHA